MTQPVRPGHKRRRAVQRVLVGASAFVVVGAAAAVYLTRPDAKPYTPGQDVEGITKELARDIPDGFRPIPFVEVASEAGLAFEHFGGTRSTQLPEDMGSGLAWGDYDGDGDPDLFVVNAAGPLTERASWAATGASHRLYRNDGDGTFTDVTASAGVGLRELGMGAAWIDFDADADLDLFVTAYEALHLFENDGDGRFEDVTERVGLGRDGFWSGIASGDADGDGDVDLYLCRYVDYRHDPEEIGAPSRQYGSVIPAALNPSAFSPQPNVLYLNRGDGTFTDATDRAGVANPNGRGLGAAWADLDEDGHLDLYVANDISDNVLFRSRGDGTFEDVSHAALVADYRGAMGLALADWDGDGDVDIFVSHWIAQENAFYVNLTRHRGRTLDTLRFMDEADRVGLGQIALDHVGWGAFFLDFDDDGRLDLFVANGSTLPLDDDPTRLRPERSHLFWNGGGDDGFFEVGAACSPWFRDERVARGAAPADFDGDGDVDIAVLAHGGKLALLRNDRPAGTHWLGVRLRSEGANTQGLGARVTVVVGDATQTQVVGATPSYLSQPELTLHFGLGDVAVADRLEVLWPGGREQVLASVDADRVVVVEDPGR